jgi:hypothetical protein
VGTLSFGGVAFQCFSDDHSPPHVYASYAGVEVIVELLRGGGVALANRRDRLKPPNAKRNDVRRVLRAAKLHEGELRKLWEKTHGTRAD